MTPYAYLFYHSITMIIIAGTFKEHLPFVFMFFWCWAWAAIGLASLVCGSFKANNYGVRDE